MFEQSRLTFTLAQATSMTQTSVYVWIAALLVLTGGVIFLIAGMHWMRAHRGEQVVGPQEPMALEISQPVQRPQVATPTTQEAQNLLRLMGEAEELCTRLGRDLDDKAQQLERLLARAEGRLGPNLAPAPLPQPAPMPLLAPEPPRVTVLPTPVSSPYYQAPHHSPHQPAYAPPARPEIVTRPVAVPSAVSMAGVGSQQQSRSTPDPFGLDPLSLEIYRLSDAGIAPNIIAQQLGQHTGKVELILALRTR